MLKNGDFCREDESGPTVIDDYIIVIQALIAESCSIKQVYLIEKEMQHDHTYV